MNTSPLQATRKCKICGQEKPLMAFLQQGGGYGQICITCKTKQASDASDDRGSTSQDLRLRLDDNARIVSEVEQKNETKEREELSKEDFEKKDILAEKDKQKKEFVETAAKKHRDYIDIKKALLTSGTANETTKKPLEDSQKRKNIETTQLINQQQNQEKVEQQKQIEQQRQLNTNIDFTTPFIGSIPLGSNINFLRMKGILGSAAPAVRLFEQAFGQKGGAPDPSKNPTSTQAAAEATQKLAGQKQSNQLYQSLTTEANRKTAQEKSDTAIEQIENTFGPSSMKR